MGIDYKFPLLQNYRGTDTDTVQLHRYYSFFTRTYCVKHTKVFWPKEVANTRQGYM